MTDSIKDDTGNILHSVSSMAADAGKNAERTGRTVLKRLILWVEKEAHLAGADIESEIASILAKLHLKAGQ